MTRRQVRFLVDEQLRQDAISGINLLKPPADPIISAMRYRTPYPKGRAPPAPITPEDDEGAEVDDEGALPAPPEPRRSPRLNETAGRKNSANFISPPTAGISTGALNKFMGSVFMDALKDRVTESETNVDPEHVANGVVHPVSKETTSRSTRS